MRKAVARTGAEERFELEEGYQRAVPRNKWTSERRAITEAIRLHRKLTSRRAYQEVHCCLLLGRPPSPQDTGRYSRRCP